MQCWNVHVNGRVVRDAFFPLLFALDVLVSLRPWVTGRSDLERPRCCFRGGVGASMIEAIVACTSSRRVSNIDTLSERAAGSDGPFPNAIRSSAAWMIVS